MNRPILTLLLSGVSAMALAQTTPAPANQNVLVVGAHVIPLTGTTACPDGSGPFAATAVPISLQNPTDVAGVQARLLYDPKVVQVVDPTGSCFDSMEGAGSSIAGSFVTVNYEPMAAPDMNGLKGINFAVAGTKGTSKTGKLLTVFFKAAAGATANQSSALTLDANSDFVIAPANSSAGAIKGLIRSGSLIIGGAGTSWSQVIPAGISGSVAAANGAVWVVGDDGILHAWDGKTGSPVAGFTAANVGGAVKGRPVPKEGAIFIATANGKLSRVDPATGTVAKQSDLSGGSATFSILSTPAVANGLVYVTDGSDKIWALDMNTLDPTKAKSNPISSGQPTGSGGFSSPAAFGPSASTTVWVGGADKAVHQYNGADLTPLKTVATGGAVQSSPFINVAGLGIVGSTDGKVYVFDAATGTSIGTFDTTASVQNSPFGIGGTQAVVVNSAGNLDLITGNTMTMAISGSSPGNTKFSGGASISQSPVVIGNTVWVGDMNGAIHSASIVATTPNKVTDIKVSGSAVTSPGVPAAGTIVFAALDGSVVALPTQ